MVTLLSANVFGDVSPSPISPIHSNSSALPSPPPTPSLAVSPLTPGHPPKPWNNHTATNSESLLPMTPPELVEDSGRNTPLETPIQVVIPPRVDSYGPPPASENDPHLQRTASSYIARPLPEPPSASPSSASTVLKPWMVEIENQSRPVTPPRSTNGSPKYSLFPKSASTTRLPTSPPKSLRPLSPVKKQPSTSPPGSKLISLFSRSSEVANKPAMREHRSKTEPFIQPLSASSKWTPRSSSLSRSQTTPVEMPAVTSLKLSTSVPPPTIRRPSAAEMIAAKEGSRGMQLKAGPGHHYQLAIGHGPEIEGQTAVKWVKRSEKIKRKPSGRDRAASTPDISRTATLQATLDPMVTAPELLPSELKIEIVEETGYSSTSSPTISRPHPLRGLDKSPSEDWKSKELDDYFSRTQNERGRTLRRTNAPSPLALSEIEAVTTSKPRVSTPAARFSMPPAKGPLQIRASTFKPFSPQLDPDALEAFKALREANGGSGLALLPASTYSKDASSQAAAKTNKKQKQRRQQQVGKRQQQSKHLAEVVVAQHTADRQEESLLLSHPQRLQKHRRSQSDPSASLEQQEELFLQVKPLPPPPPAPAHLEVKPAVQRAQSPLAKLASLVR